MEANEKKLNQEQKPSENVNLKKTETKDKIKGSQSSLPDVAPINTGDQQQSSQPGLPEPPLGPLTPEEMKKNAEDEDRKTMRVIQVVQHIGNQRIDIHPVQNVKMRSDILGMLTQSITNIQNEDMVRNNAALIKEAISVVKGDKKQQ